MFTQKCAIRFDGTYTQVSVLRIADQFEISPKERQCREGVGKW